MADKKNRELTIPPQGMWRGLVTRVKLIMRLMADRRVSPWVKLIPIGTLLYVVSPIDFIPDLMIPGVGALDDAAALGLGTYLFFELCPPDVVQEHMQALTSNTAVMDDQGDVVDADSVEVKDETKPGA